MPRDENWVDAAEWDAWETERHAANERARGLARRTPRALRGLKDAQALIDRAEGEAALWRWYAEALEQQFAEHAPDAALPVELVVLRRLALSD